MVEPLRFWRTHSGQAKKREMKRKLTSIMLSRITNWRSKGPACDTDDDETKPMPVRRKGSKKHDSAKYLASAVASKLEDGNYMAAIRLICCDDEPAPDTPETLAGLKAKNTHQLQRTENQSIIQSFQIGLLLFRFQNDRSSMLFPRFHQARWLVLTVSLHNT